MVDIIGRVSFVIKTDNVELDENFLSERLNLTCRLEDVKRSARTGLSYYVWELGAKNLTIPLFNYIIASLIKELKPIKKNLLDLKTMVPEIHYVLRVENGDTGEHPALQLDEEVMKFIYQISGGIEYESMMTNSRSVA